MKNRLLATLLTLIAIPLFATKSTAQQPSKTELLAHLKNVKAEIIDMAQQLQNEWVNVDKYADTLPNDTCKEAAKRERQNREFALKVINEFYDNSIILQQLLCNRINEDFNILCNSMIGINQLPKKLIYIDFL